MGARNLYSRIKRIILFTAGLLLLLASPLIAGAQPSVRIWPVGDSITWGCCSGVVLEGGYRTTLYQLLTNANYNVDFVGSLTDPDPPVALPDANHEGHGGYRIDEIDAGLEGWLGQIDDPDVVLLLIGVNDFLQTYDPSHAINRLQALVEHIASLRPNAKIVVANLLQVPGSSTIDNEIQTQFNPFVSGMVANEAALGRQVSFVDLRSCCGTSDFSSDGLHPNQTGYTDMGHTWFPAVTNVIGPLGTTNAPAILRVEGQVDLRTVHVTFSKPIADASTALANFSLDGGLSVQSATLDNSKRVITLGTSQQAPATTYTLTVNCVRDRTAAQTQIASNSTASFLSGPIAEGGNYTLVYSLSLPDSVDYNVSGPAYQVDNHATIGAFSRIAYYWQLQPSGGGAAQYLWASMNAFTSDPGKIGVPTYQSGAFFEQPVTNLNVRSSVAGLPSGDGLSGGNLEFWWGSYDPTNGLHVANASDTLYDWGDMASANDPGGYGSMQLHDSTLSTTLFAYNGWGDSFGMSDLGIGKYSGQNPDWTFAANANTYVTKKLQVFVQPITGANVLTVSSGNAGAGVNVTVSVSDLNGAASGVTEFSRFYNTGTVVSLTAPGTAGLASFQKWQSDGVDFSANPTVSVTMNASHHLTAVYLSGSDAASYVPESANYSLVYSLLLPTLANYSGVAVPYEVDNHTTAGPFNRIAYFLELQSGIGQPLQYIWVSSEAFTSDASLIGVPTPQSGALFQQVLTNINVRSSVAGIVTGDGIGSGNIEFWPWGYFQSNSANVPNASSSVFDWGDKPDLRVYRGSMQIHNWGVPQTLFAFNNWAINEGACEIGIGNYSGANPDWTGTPNADGYTSRKLQVYVLPVYSLIVNSVNPSAGVGITVSPTDTGGQNNGPTSFTRNYTRGTVVNLTAPAFANGNVFQKWQTNGVDAGLNTSLSVTMSGSYTVTAVYTTWSLAVQSSNPGGAVSVTVSPNDVNSQGNGTTPLTRNYTNATAVSLTAPAVANGYVFQKWQTNGVDAGVNTTLSLTMNGNYTATAIYTTWSLAVQSSNPGGSVSVTVSPNDANSQGSGTTPFTRNYTNGASVNLTAPALANGYVFQKWQTNGVDAGVNTSLTLTMNGSYTATAVYTSWSLVVQSSDPGGSVSVTVSPNDVNNQGTGTTAFTRNYTNATAVSLTAPATANGYVFQKWQTNGVDAVVTTGLGLIMNGNYTATAIYVTPTWSLSVQSSNPGGVVPVTVNPNDNNNQGNGTTPFSRTYSDGTAVTLTAPAVANGYSFQKWQTNGVDAGMNATLNLTLNGAYTAKAVYGPWVVSVATANPASGVTVTITPVDTGGNGTGTAPFTRNYTNATVVTFTAPSAAGGNQFQRWQTNGVDFSTSLSVNLTIDTNYSLTAVYAPWTVSITSANPANGVPVSVSPTDVNGLSDGTTTFARNYFDGTVVTFTAPGTASGDVFQKWQTNGVDFSTSNTINLTMDSNYTLTAVYAPLSLSVQSINPSSGVSVTVSPIDTHGLANGTTAFSRTYLYGTAVSLRAPSTASGKAFVKWETNGVLYKTTRTIGLTMNRDYIATAVYGPWTVVVNASVPESGSGVPITVTPNDTSGQGNGTTTFTRTYSDGTVMNLTAPGIASGMAFRKWQTNGVDYSTLASTSLTINTNYTVTAVYAPWALTVSSSNSVNGASVSVTPSDTQGLGDGTTSFIRTYRDGTAVTVTAANIAGGNVFKKWQENGVDYSTSLSTTVTMDADYTLTAVYAPWTLLVNSVDPGSGVTATLSPTDSQGLGDGTTSLVRTYTNGTVVTLTAEFMASGHHFIKWQTNGVDYSTNPTTTLTIDTNYVATAFYGPWTLSVQSFDPSTNVSIGVSPADLNAAADGITPFSRSYSDGAVVTLSAPSTWTNVYNSFVKWQTNGVDYSASPSIDLTVDADYTITAIYSSAVEASHIFYNRSFWDKNNASADTNDDFAIAPDKAPLQRGSKANYSNYTNYRRGINGIMVDISLVPGTLAANDFTFKVGNDNNPDAWATAPAPASITVRPGAGINRSDRVTLIWADNAIQKQWLEVNVLADANTGLASPYRFYFGNAVGETGDVIGDGQVLGNDALRILNHVSLNVPITNVFDIDRDGNVVGNDVLVTLNNLAAGSAALKWIDLSGLSPTSLTGKQEPVAGLKTSVPSLLWTETARPNVDGRSALAGVVGAAWAENGSLVIEIPGEAGKTYRLQTTEALGTESWRETNASLSISPTGLRRWTVGLDPGTPQRFYRVIGDAASSTNR